jgi:pimeloyl-ACP methyl ester carboxylesterase
MNKEITIEETRIFYRVVGSGQPIIFIHGFGEDGEVWKNQIESLKTDFRLIVPDLPGSGRSTMDKKQWTIDRFAEIIKSLLDHESISSCTMIGHSMGGYIVLAFAEKYPQLLNGFGLLHSTSHPDSEEKKATRQKGIEFIKNHGGFEFLKTAVPNLFSPKTKDERPGLVDEFLNSLRNFSGDALVSYYEAMMQRPDRTAVLKNINVAVLLIAGEFDNTVPLKDSLELAHLPGKLYFHVLKKSGHMGMLEEAEKTNRLLRNYLNDLNPNSD